MKKSIQCPTFTPCSIQWSRQEERRDAPAFAHLKNIHISAVNINTFHVQGHMDKRFWHHFLPPPAQPQDVTSLVVPTKKNYLLKRARDDRQEDDSRGIELCVCVCVFSEGEGFGVFREAAMWWRWYEVFHVKWPINGAEVALKCVMFAHTLSQTHIHTQTSTHWLKRPILRLSNTSATHTPVPMYTLSQTHTAAGTTPEALTLIVSWLSLRLSQVQYWTLTHTHAHTHTHTSLKFCEKKNDFSILILLFQKDPAVLSHSPLFFISSRNSMLFRI